MNPPVSVVIPFYNAEAFLEETIRSVITQTYPNWELLLINDGSTDRSHEIAREISLQFAGKIRLLQHPGHSNLGMSASRNLGISQATGNYIATLDADDVWMPDKLEEQVQLMESNPDAALIYGRWLHWNTWDPGSTETKGDYESFTDIKPDTLVQPPGLFEHFYIKRKGGHTPPPANILFRRDAALRAGGFENQFRGMYEDQAFLVKIFLKESVLVSDRLWCKIRHHENSFVRKQLRNPEEIKISWLGFLNWFESYLIGEKMQGTIAWKWTQKALWQHRHPFLFRLKMIGSRLTSRSLEKSTN